MYEKEKRSLVESFITAYNELAIDDMMTLTHPDIEFRNVSGGEIDATACGKVEFRRLAEQSKGLFVSRRQIIKNYRERDDQVFIEIEFEAVLAVDLPNGLKAGETIRLEGRSEYTIRDGKIFRLTDISL